MDEVGIRALKQNASEVVAAAEAGKAFAVTRRGEPVASLGPLAKDPIAALVGAGLARPAKRSLADLTPPEPPAPGERALSQQVLDDRASARY